MDVDVDVDVERILKDPQGYSSSEATVHGQLPPEVRGELPSLENDYATAVLSITDPPAHRRLRSMVIKSFTPRVLRSMAPAIESLVDEMLGRLTHATDTDLVRDFAYLLPAIVIAQLLGAPEEERERYADWSADVVAFVGTGRPDVERAPVSTRACASSGRTWTRCWPAAASGRAAVG